MGTLMQSWFIHIRCQCKDVTCLLSYLGHCSSFLTSFCFYPCPPKPVLSLAAHVILLKYKSEHATPLLSEALTSFPSTLPPPSVSCSQTHCFINIHLTALASGSLFRLFPLPGRLFPCMSTAAILYLQSHLLTQALLSKKQPSQCFFLT